jgi:hypothetical protein
MEDQRILHYFINTISKLSAPPQPVSAPVPALSIPPQDLSAPVEEVDPLYVIPNQTNILDQIAEVETENDDTYDDTSDENDDTSENDDDEGPFDTGIDYEEDSIVDPSDITFPEITVENDLPLPNDTVVTFEDAFGNTFEAPIVPPCAGHDAETEKEEFLSLTPTIADIEEYEEEQRKEFMEPSEANLDIIAEEVEDDFDLDFTSNETEEDKDNTPDFF